MGRMGPQRVAAPLLAIVVVMLTGGLPRRTSGETLEKVLLPSELAQRENAFCLDGWCRVVLDPLVAKLGREVLGQD